MFFATIAQRDPKQLVKGFLMLRFEELTDEILNLQSSTNFVVIETDAYFESYRYNLDVLLKLNERTFPMKRYIIETQKVVEKPQYLTDATTYDMRPLLLPINRASRMKMIDKFGNYNHDYIYPANIPKRMENVPVLDSDSWPTCGELNLDTSQYSALKAAVTKEFAVIQGPPGTGKTYIGLRIAQLLLHNVHKWRSRTNPSPILVLCYTNHALDQFLEGIINFTDQIVRIGSRGTNEAVSHFQINNLKRSNIIRTEMSYRIGDKMQELRRKKNSVDEAKSFLANSFHPF
ncbi:NFX1-type zinc finger-containing protein 1 [Caerostris extrusa]|uniref:NFX1-type zinc finger-containing protein 1 n=1 Tax=Caerostris extrusa TaxID=172846 RepID=A0AAV4QAC0_CAEEX|nr:NFX1-type zinc finger-containing protein 1 [Caerostris extrusa]